MVVLLFTDPQLDAGAAFILPLCAGVWWTGRLVRSRERGRGELAERSRLLAQTREDHARLAVERDRAIIAADLELRGAATAARHGRAGRRAGRREPSRRARRSRASSARGASRSTRCADARGLRSDERDTAPQPTLADLEGCWRGRGSPARRRADRPRRAPRAPGGHRARRLPRGRSTRSRRSRRATVDRAALPDRRARARDPRTAGRRRPAALAAARERVTAHGGSFSRERGADGACVLRSRLPVTAGG